MHRIEDILRQLNTVSAELQPDVAAHLLQIQSRLDEAHASQRAVHTTQAATVREVSAPAMAGVEVHSTGGRVGTGPNNPRFLGSPGPLTVAREALGGPIIVSPSAAPPAAGAPAKTLPPSSTSATDAAAAPTRPAPLFQPHEPTVPHFSLKLSPPPMGGSRPSIAPDRPAPSSEPRGPHRAPWSPDPPAIVESPPVETANDENLDQVLVGSTAGPTPATADEPGLPLFESLWFRQAAPPAAAARIVDRLLQKLSPTVPAVLHFCRDVTSRAASELISTQIAWELARRGHGRVLLVDADYGHRDISRQLGNVYLPGLSECLNLGESLETLVRPTGVEHLDWLPSGAGDISFRQIAGGRWAEISLQLRRRFHWICVHAGAAQDRVTSTWGRFCDFSYLITSMDDEHGPATKQTVEHLRRSECRLSGLITID